MRSLGQSLIIRIGRRRTDQAQGPFGSPDQTGAEQLADQRKPRYGKACTAWQYAFAGWAYFLVNGFRPQTQRSWWPVAMGLSTGLTLISCACSGSRSEPGPPVVMPRRLGTCGQTGTAAPKSSRDRANPSDSLDFPPPRRVVGRQAQPCQAPTGVSTRINVDQLTIACVALGAER